MKESGVDISYEIWTLSSDATDAVTLAGEMRGRCFSGDVMCRTLTFWSLAKRGEYQRFTVHVVFAFLYDYVGHSTEYSDLATCLMW